MLLTLNDSKEVDIKEGKRLWIVEVNFPFNFALYKTSFKTARTLKSGVSLYFKVDNSVNLIEEKTDDLTVEAIKRLVINKDCINKTIFLFKEKEHTAKLINQTVSRYNEILDDFVKELEKI